MSYTVVSGDTLSRIAGRLGVSLSALEQANPQIKNFNVIMPGQQINTPGSAPAPAAGPAPFDMNAALQQYGVLAQVVNSIPELAGVLQASAQAGDSPDAFLAKIAVTPWYQQHSDSLRNLLFQQSSDPATYQNNLNQANALVTQLAGQLGRSVDANALAYQYLAEGWTQDTLRDAIASKGTLVSEGSGAYAGNAGQLQAHLKQTAADYGVAFTDSFIDGYVNKIQSGQDTTDGFDNLMKARAKAAYPQFAQQIDGGMTLQQIADPYMATYSKVLEVPQTAVTLNDPQVQKALAQVDPKTGTQSSMPLWQFEQQLKKDPRYDYTSQAKTDAYTTLHEIGQNWGFAS